MKGIFNGRPENNDDAVSRRAKERKGGKQKGGKKKKNNKRRIGDKREQETRLIFAVWYQCNRAVTLAVEATPR